MADGRSLSLRYARCADQNAADPVHRPVVIVGAGPVGLSLAIDLAQQGIPTVVLDDDDKLSVGSRAICFAKRTLEIFDRLGCGDAMVDKGVSWNVGKVYFQDDLVYTFNLQAEAGHRRPAFINLQQYHVERYLCQRALSLKNLDVRWKNNFVQLERRFDRVDITVETPEGPYRLRCDYLIACDGARSQVRRIMGLESRGQTFRDRFLIADVRMKADFPAERWFWFDPPFHRNQSVLLHMQPDNIWRIDFQLGWDADPELEKQPERVRARVQALLGEQAEFTFEWISVYTFSCIRMDRFRHGRVIFAGDAAHGVSPFGARGANSGIQDADNLAWKLRLVLGGKAPDALLDSYDSERRRAADENIRHSTRATDFITPKSEMSRIFRDAVLRLAKDHPFARRLVNSGRLSVPAQLDDSPLNTPDRDPFTGSMAPGAASTDAPIRIGNGPDWFLRHVGGEFTGVYFTGGDALLPEVASALSALQCNAIPVRTVVVVLQGHAAYERPGLTVIEDADGWLARRFDAAYGTYYLLRPDQHVCARWRSFNPSWIRAAVARATDNG